MKDKICMITGANSGIGKAITQELAKLGAYVLMVCRDKEKGEYTQKEIINSTGNQNIDLFIADLSVQQEIRELVDNFKSKYHNLHVLINNAGLVLSKRILSADNIEMNLAVNHLAPFLLTNLLLEELKNSQPSRIINI